MRSETQKYVARKGAFISIPRGGPIHSFKNESNSVAHILCVVVPAGLEGFFEEIGKPVAAGSFLPPPPMDAQAQKQMQDIAKRYGQEVFPPDYFKK